MSRHSSYLKKFVRGAAVTPAASAARTVSGNSGWLNAEEYRHLCLTLAVTAHSGTTPTLDVIVETASDDTGTNAATVATFSQVTTTNGSARKITTGLDKFYRVAWTLGGTSPSYTFSVSGEAK